MISQSREIMWVNREFKCEFNCETFIVFESPNYDTEYTVNGRKYIGYETLIDEKIGNSEEKYGCECDRMSVYKDSYGNKVVMFEQYIPCFDSGDRQYDSDHSLYFFHDDTQIHALYCGEGYYMSKLKLFKNVTLSNKELNQYLKSEGFPIA